MPSPALHTMPLDALEDVAAYFQALSEPTRLRVLSHLRGGEASVGELATACKCSIANVSRHLALMGKHGLVARESRGTSVYYRIADPTINALCDLVCGNIARHIQGGEARRQAFTSARAPARARQSGRLAGSAEPGVRLKKRARAQ